MDIAVVTEMAHRHGVCTIADNTVASPSLLKPIEHGDIVVHSVTKYMGGRVRPWAVLSSTLASFPGLKTLARYPGLNQPEASYHGVVYIEAFGPAAYTMGAPGRCEIRGQRCQRKARFSCCRV